MTVLLRLASYPCSLAVFLMLLASPKMLSAQGHPSSDDRPSEAQEVDRIDQRESGSARSRHQAEVHGDGAIGPFTIRTNRFVLEIDPTTTALRSFRLHDPRFQKNGEAIDMVSTDRPEYLPLRFEITGFDLPQILNWTAQQPSESEVLFTYRDKQLSVTRRIQAGASPYQIWSTLHITNRSDEPKELGVQLGTYRYVPREDEAGGFLAVRSPGLSHASCYVEKKVEREDRKTLLKEHQFSGHVRFVAAESVYFVSALVPESPDATACSMVSSDRGGSPKEPHGSLFEAHLKYPAQELGPGESVLYRTMAYLGPKTPEHLQAAGHGLPKVIDYGFFSYIADSLTKLLSAIYNVVPNWGFAIILLTLLVKLLLFPLTAKSFKSMARMRLLKPELDKLNELYKEDREKRGAATMELYRKHKINPLGGCLPQLLQLPVWWALYTSLSTNVQLYHAEFALWWQDLSSPDPYFVLPVALGALMYVQQKLTPTAMDPAQAKMMLYMMPLMMMGFMLFLPSGLCLYILTNSVLSIGQQKYFEHVTSAEQRAEADALAREASQPSAPAASTKKTKHSNRRSRSGRTKTART